MHRKDVTLRVRSSKIHPIYHIEAEWLHLTPSIVLIAQDHPNNRVGGIVTDLYDLLDYMMLKSNSSSIINIDKNNYPA